MKKIRAHHFVCMQLFAGNGYSEAFVENMKRVIGDLDDNPFQNIEIVDRPDIICTSCPHLTPENTCDCDHDKVVGKDRMVMKLIGYRAGETLSFAEAKRRLGRNITEEKFGRICHDCEWYRKGLCSCVLLRAKLSEKTDS